MTRTNYANRNGFGPLEDLSQDMERVFDSLLGRTVGNILKPGTNEKFVPTLDISETEEAYQVDVDLPGVNPDEVKVEMHDGKLGISGSRASTETEESVQLHRVERSAGAFSRVIALPGEVDVDSIDASYNHGVLSIVLPKVAKQVPKKIQIRTSN